MIREQSMIKEALGDGIPAPVSSFTTLARELTSGN